MSLFLSFECPDVLVLNNSLSALSPFLKLFTECLGILVLNVSLSFSPCFTPLLWLVLFPEAIHS